MSNKRGSQKYNEKNNFNSLDNYHISQIESTNPVNREDFKKLTPGKEVQYFLLT